MRVLIVDDDDDLLSVIAQALVEAGYAVDTASGGTECLRKLDGVSYDALLLDMMMEPIGGMSVIKKLRKEGNRLPIIVVTARCSQADRVAALDCGADDYLCKPFDLLELLARIRALTRRAAGKASPTIRVGDVVVDTVGRTVSKGGKQVILTAREYALVEFLSLNSGKLVSRSMMYDHLFNEDDNSLSNVIEAHISNVRKKLGKSFIDTRRGLGYLVPAGATF